MLRSSSRLPLLALLALCVALLVPAGASAAIGPLSSFGGFGEAAGQLRAPQGLAIGSESEVYVADEDNNRIDVFSAAGTFVRAFGKDVGGAGIDVCTSFCQAGEFGIGTAGALYEPVDVALDGSGRVYVADPQNSRIDVFTTAGAFLFAFGKDVKLGGGNRCDAGTGCQSGAFESGAGAFGELEGIGIGGGRLYAADADNNRVAVYDLEGKFQFAFGRNVGGAGVHTCTSVCQAGSAEGKAAIDNPTDVAVSPDGNLYVTFNGGTSGVKIFTAAGVDGVEFGDEGPGFVDGPTAVAIGP
ncbi:MAG TPA: NHL repeat-containing protein, partial [Solirubrobacterales bacterium]|nr:NHL repeat-containing protein [Solirubrobacterales bacterium]